jgi:uncharacterized glyoxalase superfamily protein PhnB
MSRNDWPSAAPEGWPTVTPRIATPGARELVRFLRQVFDARGEYLRDRPSVIRIGDSPIMIGGAEVRGVIPAFLYVYVPDTDATCRRAVAAGARVIEAPFNTPYGDRRATVEDPWGNTWQIATPRRSREAPDAAPERTHDGS